MEDEITLRDGTRVPVRIIRPEDAPRLERFASALSPRSVYQRFGQHLKQLTPQMVKRFTNLDPERELALVALDPGSGEFIAVGRYTPNADGRTAEFALTVVDAWQGKGLGRVLLERLCTAARAAGYEALHGQILGDNHEMLDLAARLGFIPLSRSVNEVTVVRRLR